MGHLSCAGQRRCAAHRADHQRYLLRLAEMIDLGGEIEPPQRHAKQETHSGHDAVAVADAHAGLSQMQLEQAEVLACGRLRRALQKGSEPLAAVDVTVLRMRTQLARAHVFDHTLTQRGDSLGCHKPLGIAILALAALRLAVRLRLGAPPLPDDLPRIQSLAAKLSHFMLNALLMAMPLVGWGMLSAGGYPVVLYGSLHLPEILPHDDQLHAILRMTHTVLAYVFFATILLHVAAALFHALIRRDGVFRAMAGIGPRNQ
jgi:cytochrome b561